MKRFLLHDLRLVSRREKSARVIRFHPRTTVFKGENDTGKSSILKSVPWCLGAEPAKKNDKWVALEPAAALRFSIGDERYTAVRHQGQFAIFGGDGRILLTTNSVSRGLGPFLAKLVEFELTLTDRENEPTLPPPAFWLLPFYTDQDVGWKDTWCSFANLGQFAGYKQNVAEYHMGYRSNLYYQLVAQVNVNRAALEQPRLQERALVRALEQVKSRLAKLSVDFDLDRFQAEITELVKAAGGLADDEEKYRRKMGELSSQRSFHAHQLDIAQRVLRELAADYKMAVEQPAEVECPTCGATYENTVAERFKIANDEHECGRLVTELQVKLGDLNQELEAQRAKLHDSQKKHEQVWRLLQTKREAVTLQEIIRGEARGQAVEAIQTEVEQIQKAIKQLEDEIEDLKRQIKDLESRERLNEFLDRFWRRFHAYCIGLRVRAPDMTRTFVPKLNDTGSDLPRLVLAHNFAVLSMVWESGSCAHGPIILDSPHQQDPDPTNRKVVCEFIKSHMPPDSQLILALVDPCGVDFGGDVVELVDERRMLSTEMYDTTGLEVEELVRVMYETAAEDQA